MDNHTKEQRHYNMSKIRSKDTTPEEKVRKYLFSQGFRYRKNDKRYPGHPDIVLPKYKTAIFVNGCFWHMHGCKEFVLPKSNLDYWIPKLERKVYVRHFIHSLYCYIYDCLKEIVTNFSFMGSFVAKKSVQLPRFMID